MKKFNYVVTAEEGLHARPAKELVKEASSLSSVIMIEKEGQKGNAKKIFAVMALGVKKGEEVTVSVEGESEEQDFEVMKNLFENCL